MRGATTVSFAVLPVLAGAPQTPPRERDDVVDQLTASVMRLEEMSSFQFRELVLSQLS